MLTFLEETLDHLKNNNDDVSQLKIILPSKRAGGFLKNYLKNTAERTMFLPEIISIEEFIENLSGLKIIDPTDLIFQSYTSYLKIESIKEKEAFESYITWANTLLNDFNEIDRYLIDPSQFFSYLNSIKTLEKWNVTSGTTEMIENYLSFWDHLHSFYTHLNTQLLSQELGYQGAVYRKAALQCATYVAKTPTKHVFVGFNALNASEQQIIQEFLNNNKGEIYWDTDTYFYQNRKHSASLFVRKYISEWNYFETNTPKFIAENFRKEKKITSIEVQKNIGQVKYIGEILSSYTPEKINNTAIILADEHLLVPLLHSLPSNINEVNITMGVPIKNFPNTVFFELLLELHKDGLDTFYYKDVLSILHHPIGHLLVPGSDKIIQHIHVNNITQVTLENLLNLAETSEHEMLKLLFENWNKSSSNALAVFMKLVLHLKTMPQSNSIDRVVLFNIYNVFQKIQALTEKYTYVTSIKTIENLFVEAISTTTIDFKGDAYNGLQIMGVLESRVLDFENILIASVNEGIFPSGKSNASFITYDLKKEFGLPLYTEKDAIYTYHFYKMLHRASNITLLYNSYADGLNTGERSRFLLQLEVESHLNHTFTKKILTPDISVVQKEPRTIEKTNQIMERLQEVANSKFSPSALTTYIRNPVDFYYQKVLKIKESEDVEETIAANTLGTVVHNSLESLYTPFVGSDLTIENLLKTKERIAEEVAIQFKKIFKEGILNTGKNLLISEVAKRFIINFIEYEISQIKKGAVIHLLQLEQEMSVPIPISTLSFPVNIGGMVDRVDLYNGVLRIIDYKTGSVLQGQLELIDWEELTQDYKFSKAFQVLAYATMMEERIGEHGCEAGIISFKNMSGGFLKFGTKTSSHGPKNQLITKETLVKFKEQLTSLISEICDSTIPFTEKEID